MATSKRAAKTENAEYNDPGTPIDNAILTGADAANADRKSGSAAGNLADKTYYVDADGKVTTSRPERGHLLVAQGDVITERIAEQLKK